MSPIEQIQQQLSRLPLDKQNEVLAFISSLQEQICATGQHAKSQSLRQHPAFGSWRNRNVNALDYQNALRAEWERE